MALTINNRPIKSTENRNSRLVQGGLTDIYNTRLGWWERQKFERQDDDYIVVLLDQEAGRPDLIAHRVYGKAIYSWLVLQYNNIVDPELELIAGATIALPSQARLTLDIITKPEGGKPVSE